MNPAELCLQNIDKEQQDIQQADRQHRFLVRWNTSRIIVDKHDTLRSALQTQNIVG